MIELVTPSEEDIENKIINKESFLLIALSGRIMEYSDLIENIIERNRMTCRIQTKYRTLLTLPTILTPIGLMAIVAQIAHKIATKNPDWVIVKNLTKHRMEVRYCGKS